MVPHHRRMVDDTHVQAVANRLGLELTDDELADYADAARGKLTEGGYSAPVEQPGTSGRRCRRLSR
jgi:hypothetical protein